MKAAVLALTALCFLHALHAEVPCPPSSNGGPVDPYMPQKNGGGDDGGVGTDGGDNSYQVLPSGLMYGYYDKNCPDAEKIVRKVVFKAVRRVRGFAASLVRIHFHDCFVRGCDGSVLINSTNGNSAEMDATPNLSLRGFEIIDAARAALEKKCPNTVSCADIIAFAARDGVSLSMGMPYKVPSGRKDGRISLASEALTDIPAPTEDLTSLTTRYASKNLNQKDLITLSGAHTIGRSHCLSFINRLYFFNSTVSTDPSLDPAYAKQLKKMCPNSPSPVPVVFMDPPSPTVFDSSYYNGITRNRGLFTSDATLASTPASAAIVKQYVADTLLFQSEFTKSILKMGQISVLTGKQGEIRKKCSRIN